MKFEPRDEQEVWELSDKVLKAIGIDDKAPPEEKAKHLSAITVAHARLIIGYSSTAPHAMEGARYAAMTLPVAVERMIVAVRDVLKREGPKN